jgi:hypothetical protein
MQLRKGIEVIRMYKKRYLLFFLALLLCVIRPVFSQSIKQLKIEAQVKLYNLSDERYKKVYGSGSVIPNFSMTYGGGLFEIKAETEYFKKQGKMTLSGEEVTLVIFPISFGTRFKFLKSKFKPFIGAGIGLYRYKETLPPRLDDVSGSTVGFYAEIGFYFMTFKKIDIDLNAKFISAKVKNTEVNLGGLSIGFGIAFNLLR